MSNVTVLGQITVAPGGACKVTKCRGIATTTLKMRVYEQELEVPVCNYHHQIAMRPESLNPRYIIGVELRKRPERPQFSVSQHRVPEQPKPVAAIQEWPPAALPEALPATNRIKRSRHGSPKGGKRSGTTPHDRDSFKFEKRKKREAYRRQKGGWNA